MTQPRRRIVSFSLSGRGMGHVSRLVAVHSALRDRGWESLFFVEAEQRLPTEYGFEQIVLPRDSLIDDAWWRPGGEESRHLAALIVGELLRATDVVVHDVAVHRALYERAAELGCRQALLHRPRTRRPDPALWVVEHAPAIGVVYLLGRRGERASVGRVEVHGVGDVLRRPLDTRTVWQPADQGLRVAVSAAGGGFADAERFLNASLEGVVRFAGRAAVSLFVATGPNFTGQLQIPVGMNGCLRVTPYLDARHSLYRGTDVVIVHGGYNCVQELLRERAPAVTVPGERYMDDQRRRLEVLTRLGRTVLAEPTAESIARALGRLSAGGSRAASPEPCGAEDIADHFARAPVYAVDGSAGDRPGARGGHGLG